MSLKVALKKLVPDIEIFFLLLIRTDSTAASSKPLYLLVKVSIKINKLNNRILSI